MSFVSDMCLFIKMHKFWLQTTVFHTITMCCNTNIYVP